MNLGSAWSRFFLVSALVAAASAFGCAKGQTFAPISDTGDGAAGGSGTSATGGAGGATDTVSTISTASTSSSTTTTTTTTTTTSTTTSTTSTTTSTTSTTTSTLGSACDGTNNCQTCQTCAQNDTCVLETTICLIDPECLDYNDCINLCAANDDACFAACDSAYPIGSQEFLDYASCIICNACFSDCDGANLCQ